MTRFPIRLSLLALGLAAGSVTVPVTAQSVQDFQLPPNPAPTATPTPTVQGPVDVESGVPATPRPIPTRPPAPVVIATPMPAPPRDTIAAPTPAPRAQPTGTAERPARQVAPAPARSPSGAVPAAAASAPAAQAGDGEDLTTDRSAPDFVSPPDAVPAAAQTATDVATSEGKGAPIWWWFAGLLVLALLAMGAFWWRSRTPAAPLRIEPPVVRKTVSAATVAPRAALTMRPEALRLSRSVMAATLTYRLTVLNRGTEALTNVVIEADLGSASGDRPVEEQVAMATTALEPRHTMPRLAPGQSARFEGRLHLQLNQAGILRQGNTPLLVPLLRLRSTAEGIEPQAQTLAIGQQGTGGSGRLQPFRLDEGPRGYEPLAQRALD